MGKSEPLDELGELPAARALPLVRHCGKRGCRRLARPGGRYCRACATDATRAWRKRNRAALEERERARVFTEEQRRLRNARAYLATYLARGSSKAKRGRCEVCADSQVIPAWDAPQRPLEVRWLCAVHYGERREERREEAANRAADAAALIELSRAIAALPAEVRQDLHEAGLGGILGGGAEPGSLFYWWAVRRAFEAYKERLGNGDFWT